MGLDVGVLRAEELAGPFPGDFLHNVHILAAAVVPLAGIPFRVFIGEDAAHGRHNRRGNDILAGNQLNIPALALQFQAHSFRYFRVILSHKADGVH